MANSKRLKLASVIILLMALSFIAGRFSYHLFPPDYNTVKCVRVIDGDTIVVEFMGLKEHLKILDIDTPEIRRTKKLSEQAKRAGLSEDEMIERGFEAKQAMEFMVLDRKININFRNDEVERDDFGRLHAHVYIDGTNVGSHLVEIGLAEGFGF